MTGHNRTASVFRVLGVFLVSLAAAAWMAAVHSAVSAWHLQQTGVRASATVVDVSVRYSRVYLYRATIAFRDEHGVVQRVTLPGESNLWKPQVGETVQVIFPADSPTAVRVDTWNDLYLLPSVFALAGGVFLLLFRLFRV